MTPFGAEFLAFLRSAGPAGRFRLAPTPSGFLHAGNALNFILNWTAARYRGATILLRIDDLDAERKQSEYVQDVFDTLHWLGLDWDEGPKDRADFEAHWSQHRRLPLYFNTLEQLKATGHLFPCRKSRREREPFQGQYPAEFREQGLYFDDADVAWRIRTPEEFAMPDFVVRRRDGLPAYQIASLTDDQYFGITHVIRGEDLAASTVAQQFLASCLHWTEFPAVQFLHHPLLKDASGEKLSKSAGASALRNWRAEGRSPAELYECTARWLGLPCPEATAAGLLEAIKKGF